MIEKVDELSTKKTKRGGKQMTNSEELKKRIRDSGLKINYVAERLGLTYQGLKNKLDNESEFKASEILELQKILGLADDDARRIFFGG
jgi:hypothetical protein